MKIVGCGGDVVEGAAIVSGVSGCTPKPPTLWMPQKGRSSRREERAEPSVAPAGSWKLDCDDGFDEAEVSAQREKPLNEWPVL
jgi:hypothetical protein